MSHQIPVVLVVVEGGTKTILTVKQSLASNPAVPVVIAKGSGRAADILAFAYQLYLENEGFVFIILLYCSCFFFILLFEVAAVQ